MQRWIEEHGTDEIKRAYREGYGVSKGISDTLIDRLEESLALEILESWRSVEERTSPSAASFAKRDLILAKTREIPLPDNWTMEVSRISRVTLEDGTLFTGVMVGVRDEKRKLIRHVAVDFES